MNRYLKDLIRPYLLGELTIDLPSSGPATDEFPRETFYRIVHLQPFMPAAVQQAAESPPDDGSSIWELMATVEPRKYPEHWRMNYLRSFSVEYDDLRKWARRHGGPWLIRWFKGRGEKCEDSEPLIRAWINKRVAEAEPRGGKFKRNDLLRAARKDLTGTFSDRAFFRVFRDCVPRYLKYSSRPTTRNP